jgi:hypothetical protein
MFCTGISSYRIQTIGLSRNGNTFDEIAVTALEEENAIVCKNKLYRQGANPGRLVCHKCRKTGLVAAKCYLKDKKYIKSKYVGGGTKRNCWETSVIP